MKLLIPLMCIAFLTAFPQGDVPVTNRTTGSSADCSSPAKFDPARDAAQDIRDALDLAGRTGRRVLLDVGGEWCVWCHRLDRFFMENQEVCDSLHAAFVVVKVNYSKENKNEAVLSHYPKVQGYPHFFVLSEAGELLHSQNTGALESGKGYDMAKILNFLNSWRPPVDGE